ncbi:hypothetical protein ACHAWF_005188 [Thalassiosira exigua]
MGRADAAFPLIRSNIQEHCRKLFSFLHSSYWIHESVVSKHIGLPRGDGMFGPVDCMTALLACIKRGKGGSAKKGTETSTNQDACNLYDQSNASGIFCQYWGIKEEFLGGALSSAPLMRHPRFFHFGDNFDLELCRQKDIASELVGDRIEKNVSAGDPSVIPLYQSRRRQGQYKSFCRGHDDCIPFKTYDVSAIAAKFLDTWDGLVMSSSRPRRRSFHPVDLEMIEDDFRHILLSCNYVGSVDVYEGQMFLRMSSRAKRIHVARERTQSTRTNGAVCNPNDVSAPATPRSCGSQLLRAQQRQPEGSVQFGFTLDYSMHFVQLQLDGRETWSFVVGFLCPYHGPCHLSDEFHCS